MYCELEYIEDVYRCNMYIVNIYPHKIEFHVYKSEHVELAKKLSIR